MRTWVDEESEPRDVYRELVTKARKRERNEAALLQDPELQTAVDWRERVKPSPGWASRYSEAAGDFDSAMRYIGESVSARSRSLADAEEARRWRIWSPMILLVEIAMGLWLANATGFLTKFDMIGHTSDPRVAGTPFRDLARAVWSMSSLYMALFLGACVAASLGFKWMHRRFAHPGILRRIVASGGRPASEGEAATANLPEAAVVHHTTHAAALRRIGGAAVDGALVALIAVALIWTGLTFAPEMMEMDYHYVLTRGVDSVSAPSSRVFFEERGRLPVEGTDSTGRPISAVGRFATSAIRALADGKLDTVPVRPRISPAEPAETDTVLVDFPSGPSVYGTLTRGAQAWTLTVTRPATVYDTAYSAVSVAPGSVVTFPPPNLAAWEVEYDFGSGGREAVTYIILLLVAGWLYSALQVSGRRHATLGMRLVGIFRTDLQGKRLTFAKASAMFGYRVLGFVLWPGLFVHFFTRRGQAFHDWMGGSVVLRGKAPGIEAGSRHT